MDYEHSQVFAKHATSPSKELSEFHSESCVRGGRSGEQWKNFWGLVYVGDYTNYPLL